MLVGLTDAPGVSEIPVPDRDTVLVETFVGMDRLPELAPAAVGTYSSCMLQLPLAASVLLQVFEEILNGADAVMLPSVSEPLPVLDRVTD